jgi:membrane protein DedA with SNARE-associated domain
VEDFLDQYGYIALFFGTFLEGETAILVASSLIHPGIFEMPYTILAGFGGSFISDWIYYIIGRLNGKYFVDKRPRLKNMVQPVRNFFEHHKLQLLLSYRFLYGFRIVIPLVIGMSSVKPAVFLLYSIISGVLWASIVSLSGFLIGRFFDVKTSVVEENFLLIIGFFMITGLFIGYFVKKATMKKINLEK